MKVVKNYRREKNAEWYEGPLHREQTSRHDRQGELLYER